MAAYAGSAPEHLLGRYLQEAGHEVVPLYVWDRPGRWPIADVYHVNHFGTAAYELALSGVGPLVFTPHDGFILSDRVENESRVDRTFRALVFRRADAVIALSNREADVLEARFSIARDKLHVIPNGLDLDRYSDGPRSSGGSIELLSVGQLAWFKGHDYLFEALASLAPKHPGLRLRLVSHNARLRELYEQRCRELGIADRVTFDGPLTTDELIERYRACDIYVQPSLVDCYPVTVLEAMACGRPVIATNVGGVPEEIGAGGVIVPPRDAAALAAAIERLAVDPAERRALGERALVRAHEFHDGRRVADLHLDVYASVADRRKTPQLPARLLARGVLAAYDRKAALGRFVPASVRRRSASAASASS